MGSKQNNSKLKKNERNKKRSGKPKNKANILKCSTEKMLEALGLVEENMRKRSQKQSRIISRCQLLADSSELEVLLPQSSTYITIQIRNAFLTHNWEAAALLLLKLLKCDLRRFHKHIWRVYYVLLHNLPQADSSRIEQFRDMCSRLFKESNVLKFLYMPQESGN